MPNRPSTASLVPGTPSAGAVVAGRYRLVREIGRGSSGRIWEAVDTRLRRPVALKFLEPTRLADVRLRQRFQREALATARIVHEHVARLYDVVEEGEQLCLVMELVDGPPLSAVVSDGAPCEDGVTAAIGVQVARGLQAAHDQGFVHRDIKPANVLLRPDGSLAVIDFGIARLLTETSMTGGDVTVGTARYVAPEQVAGERAGPAADVYAVGLLLWESATGEAAFAGDSVAAVAMARLTREPDRLEHVDPLLADVVERATRRDPQERFASAAALAGALEALAGPRPGLVTRTLLRQDGRE